MTKPQKQYIRYFNAASSSEEETINLHKIDDYFKNLKTPDKTAMPTSEELQDMNWIFPHMYQTKNTETVYDTPKKMRGGPARVQDEDEETKDG